MSRPAPSRSGAPRPGGLRSALGGSGAPRTLRRSGRPWGAPWPRGAGCRRRPLTVAAAVLAALLLTGAAAEAAARVLLHDRLAAVAGRTLGPGAQVGFGGRSALVALAGRHLDAVTVTGGHLRLGGVPDASVRARLDDVRLTGGHSATVARTRAEVDVPAASLQAMAGAGGGGLPVTAVRPDPAAGTVTVALGGAGLARAVLRPRLDAGRVRLVVRSVDVLGAPAPAALVDRVRARLSERATAAYPLGLRATSVRVTADGLHVTLAGGRTRLPAGSPATTPARPAG
ncbi:LmeA family phospholipid-binding protein [Streptomyces tropicalis]|uniref:DUF2993 domain-containing protein n=1 Tax=Streptomyces tropicalis TaxID=3034234 RepID=A0ABT6A367_9ACTN|nr:DUF2993 domain-containing protein [Streptomyces tropicalis]MDF3299100.1 DUF2993 domain-containing protein [Streptomyces tropicalis]